MDIAQSLLVGAAGTGVALVTRSAITKNDKIIVPVAAGVGAAAGAWSTDRDIKGAVFDGLGAGLGFALGTALKDKTENTQYDGLLEGAFCVAGSILGEFLADRFIG